ncbi:hypothetical protein E1A91_A05G090600v1 [Gossypium mustelinum]|uniref:Uncharacterized protein n=3 Tax=Gossypium TaxID=3633 RepID=A0ABR0PUJ4_GOSAR|nr:uncharacterized protein LOC108451394 [Gossypium arboreum]KAK5830542.1 hypothetical protein PVK06_014337 [Gossypium arboreum]TYI26099.1 hypothetical protein ES332_A05G092200v1 [Gossypium tomentosum]TYJ33258.1 hypothetical protein E1A91_A05G090600v1 [Gossypium mustelinum]
MEHHRSQREACTSDLTEMLFSQPNGSEVTQTPDEKRMKNTEADRIYRKNYRDMFDKMKAIASRFGGVDNMEHHINQMEVEQPKETEFRRLEQMKCKFGGIEEMGSKLHAFHRIASMPPMSFVNTSDFTKLIY